MLIALGVASVVLGCVYIWVKVAGRQRLAFWIKPLPVALAMLAVLMAGRALPPPVSLLYALLIAVGLLFSMAGDLLLAWWPKEKFEAGLVAFLIAHLVYIAAFAARAGFHAAPVALVSAGIYCIGMLVLLLPRVEAGVLRVAVTLYMLALLGMFWQAAGMRDALGDRAAALAVAGAAFFVISDSVLAWDRFRKALPLVMPLVMTTYYVAQWLLALSVFA